MHRTFVAALAALPLAVPVPASAGPGFVFRGSGTISPGHSSLPTPQSISLHGTLTDVASARTYACSYSGTETGSIPWSLGDMGGTCGGPGCPGGPYTRVGAAWTWVCTRATGTSVVWQCVFQPHQTLPTTSYDLTCAVP